MSVCRPGVLAGSSGIVISPRPDNQPIDEFRTINGVLTIDWDIGLPRDTLHAVTSSPNLIEAANFRNETEDPSA